MVLVYNQGRSQGFGSGGGAAKRKFQNFKILMNCFYNVKLRYLFKDY